MQPRSRAERHGLVHKEALEKARLRHRSGGFFRYEDIQNPVAVLSDSPAFLGRRGWMTAGPACEEVNYAKREHAKVMRDEKTEARRARNYEREEHRLRAMDANERAMAERVERLQADPMMGRKNISGQHGFNLINQTYESSPAGACLQHHDAMIRYKAKVRAANLAMRGHLGFNPILGEQTYGISLPPPPKPPSLTRGDWDDSRSTRSMSSTRSAPSMRTGGPQAWTDGFRAAGAPGRHTGRAHW
eukprot:gb/GFBE01002464.1/.p1 GENE.gb/GFBE01002464.1/~~gb/GFBE01002464.1/.p1  ORF type:complete len:245 (+),score=33.02 gb/GFBE01002464.1/:1-735(+)